MLVGCSHYRLRYAGGLEAGLSDEEGVVDVSDYQHVGLGLFEAIAVDDADHEAFQLRDVGEHVLGESVEGFNDHLIEFLLVAHFVPAN